MDQIKIGKFIASSRKETGLTQAKLAEMLNITDRAVSKWETGKSLPDSSIMLELCEILGITVNELLSGERIEMEKYEEKVNENLIELKRRDENNINARTVISIVFSVIMFTGMLVCCICDFAISKAITWSGISLSSILFAWLIMFPLIFWGKKALKTTLLSTSIFILPFILVISFLTQTPAVLKIGTPISVLSIAFIWMTYFLVARFKNRLFLAIGSVILLVIPFSVIINLTLAQILGIVFFDIWDAFSGVIIVIIAASFIIADYKKSKYPNTITQ